MSNVETRLAFRLRMARDRAFFRNLYTLACLAAILGIYVRLSGHIWWSAGLFFVACVLLLERMVFWRLRAAAHYRTTSGARDPVQLRIDDSNLIRTSATRSSEIRWANILACHETKNLYLLRLGPDEVLAIPKRAFSPGDLFRFKELRQSELIVKTTRENPDILLLKFVVGWGLIAIAVMALFIGKVHDFLADLPRTPAVSRPSAAQDQPATKLLPASPAELRGRGSVYPIPPGTIRSVAVYPLLEDLRRRYGLQMRLLAVVPPPAWAENRVRKQFVAEDLVTAMKLAYPKLAADPAAILIGLTDADMYISELDWSYAFSFRSEDRFAIISSAHLSESEDDDKPVGPEVMQKRVRKALVRDVGILHYRLQPSNDYESVLYDYIGEAPDLDDVGEDFLEGDVEVRADLHLENGDPCFIVRHYAATERSHPETGTVAKCSGYYSTGPDNSCRWQAAGTGSDTHLAEK